MFWFLPLIALYIPPIAMLIAFIVYFGKVLVTIFSIIPPLLEMAVNLFLNPTKLANDIITGVIIGFTLFVEKLFGYINPAYYQDKLKNSSENNIDTVETNCYSTSFMSILLLIVCPPFAVWQTYGVSGFKEVILCTLLTVYGYYFPGLIYALLITEAVNKNGKRCKD